MTKASIRRSSMKLEKWSNTSLDMDAEADRLLEAHDNDPSVASRFGDVSLSVVRALRNDTTDTLSQEWRDYIARRGRDAVYSFMLASMRAGMWPRRHILETEDVPPGKCFPGTNWAEPEICNEQLGWLSRHVVSARCFAIAPVNDHADIRVRIVRTRSKIYALFVTRYENTTTMDIGPVAETHLGRGIDICFGVTA